MTDTAPGSAPKMKLKYGKLAVKEDPRTFLFEKFIFGKLPETPDVFDWSTKVADYGMRLNDQYGCCAIAAAVHMIMTWTSLNGEMAQIPDEVVKQVYMAVSGFDGVNEDTDSGCIALDVLNYWRKNGIAGHKISAFAKINPKNHAHVLDGAFLDMGLFIGARMPDNSQDQFIAGQPWSIVAGTQIEGGHAINNVASWEENGVSKGLIIVTWGKEQKVTWEWWDANVDECYAIFSEDFIDSDKIAANNFNVDLLRQYINLL